MTRRLGIADGSGAPCPDVDMTTADANTHGRDRRRNDEQRDVESGGGDRVEAPESRITNEWRRERRDATRPLRGPPEW